jgi:hypothetical protein
VTARTLQGMARVRSGQAPAWPLVSDRSVRSGSRVKRDFACTLAGAFPPVLVSLRAQSRLRLEGRTPTLSGPSPDLTSSVGLLHDSAHLRQARSRRLPCYPGVAVTTLDRPPERARGGHDHDSGGRQLHLANLCGLPARTRSPRSRAARIIPRIFRIMIGRAFRPSANGRTYSKLARIVRELCAVAGRCREPVAAAVAVSRGLIRAVLS